MAEIKGLVTLWEYTLDNTSELFLKTGLMFGLHELFYWSCYIPFLICDQIPYLRRYKIQEEVTNTLPDHWKCFKLIIMNHFAVVLPLLFVTHMFESFALNDSRELPSIKTMIVQILMCFLIEDFFFYWGHRALHTRFLYRLIHHVHHEHSAPFGLAAEYAHPLEVIFLGMATIIGPMLMNLHVVTTWIFLFFRCLQTIECHSGYNFPWSLNNWFPFYGGADFHDHHHKHFSGNYASTFTWADYVHGTDTAYRKWKAEERMKCASKYDTSASSNAETSVQSEQISSSEASVKHVEK